MKTITRLLGTFVFVGLCVLVVTMAMPASTHAEDEGQTQTICSDFCGRNWDKIIVCHAPPGNPDEEREICVRYESLDAHFEHGDFCGFCDGD